MSDRLADNEDLVDAIAETMYQHVAIELRQVPEHWDNQTGTTQGAWRYEAKRLLAVVDEHLALLDNTNLPTGVNGGPGSLSPDGADDAPDEPKGSQAATHSQDTPAPVGHPSEPLITADREALVTELRRHIGAHADIVANDLLASGAVVSAGTLADDEALVQLLTERIGLGPISNRRTASTLRALAAALGERSQS